MNTVLKIEEIFMLALGFYAFSVLNMSWWWFFGFILVPDIGMLGYSINAKVGAFLYNICHHKGIAIALYFCGIYFENDSLKFMGIILFSHSAMDRVFGYGLKYSDSFKNTHLGEIGK